MRGPHAFTEVIRTVTVSYPIPFMLACLLAFALGCMGLAVATASVTVAVVMLVTGCLTALAGVGFAGYALLRRPDLLRSERFNVLNRYIDLIGDDRNKADQPGLDRAVLTYLEEAVPKKAVSPSGRHETGVRRNADQ